jgi:hypothetical protein
VTDRVELWDAGTEPNAQPPGKGPDQAPAQNGPMQGADEDGVVRRLGDVDDGHAYPAAGDVIRVTLTPHGAMDDGTQPRRVGHGEGAGTRSRTWIPVEISISVGTMTWEAW